MNEQRTQCIENSAVRKSYRATVQSAEIVSLISAEENYWGDKAPLPEHIELQV